MTFEPGVRGYRAQESLDMRKNRICWLSLGFGLGGLLIFYDLRSDIPIPLFQSVISRVFAGKFRGEQHLKFMWRVYPRFRKHVRVRVARINTYWRVGGEREHFF